MSITTTHITESNMKIIRLMGEGMANKEIAQEMNLSQRTIEDRVCKMMKDFDCKSRTQLVLKVVLFNIQSFTGK